MLTPTLGQDTRMMRILTADLPLVKASLVGAAWAKSDRYVPALIALRAGIGHDEATQIEMRIAALALITQYVDQKTNEKKEVAA